ncbi:MAG: trypsin-like peptidase domain-containing protein [Planctomycetota bacterium]
MKRTLVEILFGGAMGVLLMSFHADLRDLRSVESERSQEFAQARRIVEEAQGRLGLGLPEQVDRQATVLEQLQGTLGDIHRELRWIKGQLDTRTEDVAKQARAAYADARKLEIAVETTQKLVTEKTSHLRASTESLLTRLETTEGRLQDLTRSVSWDPSTLSQEMIAPCVQLSGDETVGSGTLVASIEREDGKGFDTWVLTAYHVVRNILADDPTLARKGIDVVIYTPSGKVTRKCDVIATEPSKDLAVARLRGTERVQRIARLSTRSELATTRVWTPVFAIGCPLGNDPIPTGGCVASLHNEVGGANYWMINAPTYFGNSGGGIYNAQTRKLLAVFSKIYTHGNTRPVVIPHMGLGVPLTQVYDWLEKEKLGFLVPSEDQAGPEQKVYASPVR